MFVLALQLRLDGAEKGKGKEREREKRGCSRDHRQDNLSHETVVDILGLQLI